MAVFRAIEYGDYPIQFCSCAMRTSEICVIVLMMATYPFIPKTTSKIRPGDFWSIRLDDGRYSAGRVLQVLGRVMLLGAVLDWSGEHPPTGDAIAGASILDAGRMHVRAIAVCGEGILGNRSLASDNIQLPLFRSHAEGPWQRLLEGVTDIGPASEEHRALPVLSTWGLAVAKILANRKFCPRA